MRLLPLTEFRAIALSELDWRTADFRLLATQIENVHEAQRDQFRRFLIVMLYAHFEGFTKVVLLQYITEINSARIDCRKANAGLVAGAWHKEFVGLDSGAKSPFFRNVLPDDSKLHRYARRKEFVERIDELLSRPVSLPEDLVDTESNLTPTILRRMLFMVGLDHGKLDHYEAAVSELVARRNSIAHGASRKGIVKSDYERLEAAVFAGMKEMVNTLESALNAKEYLRPVPPGGA